MYDAGFFDRYAGGSLSSARAVCPLVLSLVPAKSVVDVGCGIGTWLRAFLEAGVDEVLGIDGDYVDRAQLMIPAERFLSHDLTQPVPNARRFDLAVSLEVAEHIDPAFAGQFVSTLAGLSDVVLFSAAIPGQGGTNHVNEQWPQYWEKLFRTHDYAMLDCIREKTWNNPEVEAHYSQNTFLCVHQPLLERSPALKGYADRPVRALVHPAYYDYEPSLTSSWTLFRSATIRALKKRLGIKRRLREVLPFRA